MYGRCISKFLGSQNINLAGYAREAENHEEMWNGGCEISAGCGIRDKNILA